MIVIEKLPPFTNSQNLFNNVTSYVVVTNRSISIHTNYLPEALHTPLSTTQAPQNAQALACLTIQESQHQELLAWPNEHAVSQSCGRVERS